MSSAKDALVSRTPALLATSVYNLDLTEAIDATDDADLVKAGLHLLNDDLDRAHVIAQQHEGDPAADYWHAIVHRREGDYGDSKYWFARAGDHPVIREIHGSTMAANAFVDRCRALGATADVDAQDLQRRENLFFFFFFVFFFLFFLF